MNTRAGLLRQVPRATLLLLTVPVLAGLAGTLIPAADPAALQSLIRWPGLAGAVKLSLVSGMLSTLLALILSLGITAALLGSRHFNRVQALLSPLLSVPHAAAALGLAFLIAPSGWIARALSPWATGWTQPPDLLILNDPMGIALILGLTAKEMPFLLLMILAALPQTDANRRLTLAASLGYGRLAAFTLTVLPALYPLIRLPVYAVLAYAMTAVDMAMILGPSLPPSLSVQITRWMTDPNLADRGIAASAALLQLMLVIATLTIWHGAERALGHLLTRRAASGHRAVTLDLLRPPLIFAALTLAVALIAGLAGLSLWSVASLWPFPDALPDLSLKTWTRAAPALMETTGTTLTLALLSTGAALALVLASLEAEHRYRLTPKAGAMALLYLPLIMPQVAFLPGLQVAALRLGAMQGLLATAFAHLIFVLPYVFLSLAAPYRAFDPRITLQATTLGAAPNRIFWTLRLPMLLSPVLTAAAVGLAVSIGQYLPSLLIGGGRVVTLTTEAIALSSGGNRRIVGAYALLQMLLPAIGFAIALILPRLVFRNRRGMLPA